MRTLSRVDLENLIVGATIMGVGGGGSPENGLKAALSAMETGRKIVLVDVEDLKEGDLVASPYYVGSVAPTGRKPQTKVGAPMAEAAKLLEETLKTTIRAVVPSEIGGGNTGAALAIGAELGVPAVDGDLMGRAGPELHQNTANIFGFSLTPSAIVSESGNRVVVHGAAGIDEYEAIARHLAVVSGGHAAVVDTPLVGSQAKKCVVRRTLSQCIRLGEARTKALQSGEDPVLKVASELRNGRVVLRGTVTKYDWRDEAGFLKGEVQVEGSGDFRGRTLRTWIMNEHIFCWIDNKPAIMPPDLIVFLDASSALGITNDRLRVGQQVAVVGASIDNVWRSPLGLEVFGPKHFGFQYDYVPFEELYR
jgi:DUF917 family protein